MITRFYWHACTVNYDIAKGATWGAPPVDSFYVEFAPGDPWPISPEHDEWCQDFYREHESERTLMVARDLSRIWPCMWVYPTSGMWNSFCPFVPIGPPDGDLGLPAGIYIKELKELQDIPPPVIGAIALYAVGSTDPILEEVRRVSPLPLTVIEDGVYVDTSSLPHAEAVALANKLMCETHASCCRLRHAVPLAPG